MGSAGKLRAYVHVKNPETGSFTAFGPDDKLPSWASKELAKTPHVFTTGDPSVDASLEVEASPAEDVDDLIGDAPEKPKPSKS